MNLNPDTIYIEKKEYEAGENDKPKFIGEVYDFRVGEFLTMFKI
jgi:hypothetical protein